MCLYGLPRQPGNEDAEEGLFEYVARLNGPLADYHPQMLLQCLLWGKSLCFSSFLGLLTGEPRQTRCCQGDSFEPVSRCGKVA
jgi:hypothetical protein